MKNNTDNYYVEIVVMDPINNNVIFRLSPGSTTAAKTWKNQIIDVSKYDSIKFFHRVFVADIKITNLRLV